MLLYVDKYTVHSYNSVHVVHKLKNGCPVRHVGMGRPLRELKYKDLAVKQVFPAKQTGTGNSHPLTSLDIPRLNVSHSVAYSAFKHHKVTISSERHTQKQNPNCTQHPLSTTLPSNHKQNQMLPLQGI